MNVRKIFRISPVQIRLLFIVTLFVIFSGSFLFINYANNVILSVVRAYISGESAYSKGQKDAVFYLRRYASSHLESDYALYQQHIAIPVGDRNARLELEKPNPDINLASQWFIQGQNHPADVKQMALFFKYLDLNPHTSKSVNIWRQADRELNQLMREASVLHQLISTGTASQQEIRQRFNRVLTLNQKLSILENDFSTNLGNAARDIQSLLFNIVLGIVSALITVFGFISFMASKRIRDSEERYRTLFEESQSGIILSTPQGTITDINPAAVQLLDLVNREQVLLHYRLKEIYAAFEFGAQLYQRLMQDKQLEMHEVGIQHKNGNRHFISLGVSGQTDKRGNLVGFRHVIRDVTERKLAEEQLLAQNEELKKINAELDSFVYRASHDLRAPLSSISGLINIAREEKEPKLQAYYFDLMIKSLNKLDTFIRSIINYSRNARLEVKPQLIDFQQLIDDAFNDLQYMEGINQIEKRLELNLTHAFYSDIFRLQIIFNNFISNAVKYRNLYTDSYIIIRVSTSEQKAHIEFEDNGIGIGRDKIERIFEMFYRATEKNAGSGLGLYIVHEAIGVMDGSIKVESQLGKGTTFSIDLPNIV